MCNEDKFLPRSTPEDKGEDKDFVTLDTLVGERKGDERKKIAIEKKEMREILEVT